MRSLFFQLGYTEARGGVREFNIAYENWTEDAQRDYESGRLVALTMVLNHSAPEWKRGTVLDPRVSDAIGRVELDVEAGM